MSERPYSLYHSRDIMHERCFIMTQGHGLAPGLDLSSWRTCKCSPTDLALLLKYQYSYKRVSFIASIMMMQNEISSSTSLCLVNIHNITWCICFVTSTFRFGIHITMYVIITNMSMSTFSFHKYVYVSFHKYVYVNFQLFFTGRL